MNRAPKHTIRRPAALLLALALFLTQGMGLAHASGLPVSLLADASFADGTAQSYLATPVAYTGYEDAFWLYLPQEALGAQGLTLRVDDPMGLFPGGFAFEDGTPVPGFPLESLLVTDSGDQLLGEGTAFSGLNANGEELSRFRLFVSLSAPMPLPPQEDVPPAEVTVEYVDEAGRPVAPSTRQTLPEGSHIVYAQPENLPLGYELIDSDAQDVVVDRDGAHPSVVTFRYRAPQPTEAPTEAPTPEPTREPVQDALVLIEYRDESGIQIAPSVQQMLPPGVHQVLAQPEGLTQEYEPVGPESQTVEVDASGAHPSVVTFRYRAPIVTPAPTEEPVSPAEIQVLYLDEGGNEVAGPQRMTLPGGVNEVRANPAGLLPGYQPIPPLSQAVVVDRNGANPAQVVFYYRQETAQSGPVDVILSYVNEQGDRVATETVFQAHDGQNPVSPAPTDLLAGYTIKPGEEIKYVSVRDNQANPQALTFTYVKTQGTTATPPPAPKVALVSVRYVTERGDLLYSETVPAQEGVETVIRADLTRVNAAVYAITGPDAVSVTVDGDGRPSAAEVRFVFRDVTVRTATVTLRYLDEAGSPLSPEQQVEVDIGSTLVSASPAAMPLGYDLISQNPVAVTLSDSGVLSQAEVTFIYRAAAVTPEILTPTPEPTVIPFAVTTLDRYGYPTGDAINFRSAPGAGDAANIIAQLNQQTVVHLLGTVKNAQGETWYLAEAGGREGFLKETVVRLMTWDESVAYFGWTPSPAPQPTPMEDAPLDGEPIDRWAEVSDQGGVNFRAQPSASSTKISKLDRGERVWVYSQTTVGDTVWFSIMASGRKGYVNAGFLRLMSREESQQYQAQLASPMPTVPQASLTPAPVTPQPTVMTDGPGAATPTPTLPPTSYHGYALTTRQAALRTGASQVDEPVLEILEVNSLVYVWGQTFIGTDGWSYVEVMADSAYGYLPNASLRYVNDQEAAVYLNMLRPQDTDTPPPTALPAQRTGYAITLGENVPARAFADTNAQIMALLPDSSVVAVRGQEYTAGTAWHLIQYADLYGFVRADQVRLLSPAEEASYLQSLRTPTPAPAATLPPVTLNSPSSYGYVNTDRVRLRSGPSTTSQEIKLMGRHSFALVYGSSQQQDGTWYHISQGGSVGYVNGNYFTVLPMGELATYLQSPEYLSANSDSIPVTGGYQQPTNITPVEDFNTTVWQNPALLSPSYEPFNPLGTPTPPVEAIFTPTPSPTPRPLIAPTVEGFADPPEAPQSSFPTGLLAVGLAALLGGGGYYAYYLYNQNQKRMAERMAQRRSQAQGGAGAPQARPAQPSPYMPPRPPQGAVPYRPGTGTPAAGQAPQGTAPYRPGVTPPSAQGQPPTGTAQYRPGTATPPAPGQPPMGTAQYRPGAFMPPAQGQSPQGAAPYRPGNFAPPAQGTSQPRPPAPTAQTPPQQPATGADAEVRRRRAQRHDSSDA